MFKNILNFTALTGFFPTVAGFYFTNGLTAGAIAVAYLSVLVVAVKIN